MQAILVLTGSGNVFLTWTPKLHSNKADRTAHEVAHMSRHTTSATTLTLWLETNGRDMKQALPQSQN